MSVGRDPFARGGFQRQYAGKGRCDWCGDQRQRLYRYVWVGDDSTRGPSILDRHLLDHAFCNMECFRSYHS